MVKIITYATEEKGALPQLHQSFERFRSSSSEHELIVLGTNMKWCGFGHRIHSVLNYAENCHKNDLLLCVDAYDVILTGDLGKLESTFSKLVQENNIDDTKTVIISEERYDFFQDLWAKFTFGAIQDKHLCAGVYMGKASAVTKMLRAAIRDPSSLNRHFDDQKAFNKIGNEDNSLFHLDSEWDLFATFYNHPGTNNIEFNLDGTLMYEFKPVFTLHMPGNTNMISTLKKLGYDTSNYTFRDKYLLEGLWHNLQTFQNVQMACIILGVVLIVCLICVVYQVHLKRKKKLK